MKKETIDLDSLHQHDIKLLTALRKEKEDIESIAKRLGLSKDALIRSAFVLKDLGLVDIVEEAKVRYVITGEGNKNLREGFPEERLLSKDGTPVSSLSEEERRIGLQWAMKNGWVRIAEGKIKILSRPEKYDLREKLKAIEEGRDVDKETVKLLLQRKNIEETATKKFFVRITDLGMETAPSVMDRLDKEEINELTHSLITSGKWRNATFRKYNLRLKIERARKGAYHPVNEYIRQIREVFVSMGFEEMTGPEVDSAFWDFDALFTPQDHPARELQDTFYLENPEKFEYPEDVAERVKEIQEKAWKYKWDPEIPRQAVLRTHTTTLSAHTLVSLRKGKRSKPGKFFAIGRVYRNEATDFKHLAEFYQIEGIVAWKKATFRDLLGVLSAFYEKQGIKIRFRPHYFPYTEPSVEIDRWDEKRNQWIELAGAGILRPEVSLPLWGSYPVLAWGMSLERPLMNRLNLKDIRIPYQNDIYWIADSQI
ncbi:MAG: phenylalanine--tRNA ligase subunit alpha [Candidatus Micrarchaeota archaeon]|nr:phenylalanine--tRNA ligase subunit alpha [Candidatus Micrarchaeota archaeon]